MRNIRKQASRAFTLVELMVVIAIISLLITVMVPVMIKFMKGRGLTMAGNNVAGFMTYGRSEAMNKRDPHVIVFYPETIDVTPEDSTLKQEAGPGLVMYRVRSNPKPDQNKIEFVRELTFGSQIGGDLLFADEWLGSCYKGASPELDDAANSDRRLANFYKIVIRPDGRANVPQDRPGYMLDTMDVEDATGITSDIVLTDGENILFVDINPATCAVRRGIVVEAEITDYKGSE